MPWKECSVMEERLRFVARLLDGEGTSDVYREFGKFELRNRSGENRTNEHEVKPGRPFWHG